VLSWKLLNTNLNVKRQGRRGAIRPTHHGDKEEREDATIVLGMCSLQKADGLNIRKGQKKTGKKGEEGIVGNHKKEKR